MAANLIGPANNRPEPGKPVGLILAGGAARRMGGGDKAFLLVGGRSILRRLLDGLGPQCAALAVSAAGDASRWPLPPEQVLADPAPGRSGPLAGVLAGLMHLDTIGHDARTLLTVPGDTPFIPPDLADRLEAARTVAGARTAIAMSGDRVHPATALWCRSVRPQLQAYLETGRRGVRGFHDEVGTVAVRWDDRPVDPFFNVNTPDDLTAADRLARIFGS